MRQATLAVLIFGTLSIGVAGQQWPHYAGDHAASHYSPLDQITAANAGSLSLSSGELQLDHTTLTHSGTGALVLQSQGPRTVVANDALLITGGSLQLDAAALQASRSLISAQTDAQLNVQGAMTATEATLVANGALGISAGSLRADRADLVGVDGGATLTIAGAASLREGSVQSRANIGISAQSLDSTQGLISGQDISIDTQGGALGNADGAILAARHLNIASGAIDNQRGVLQGGGNASIAASGAVNNQGGQILAGGTLSLSLFLLALLLVLLSNLWVDYHV